MESPHVTIGSFDRQNLFYHAKSFERGNAFLDELVKEISTYVQKACSTIVYCTTVKDVEQVSFSFSFTFWMLYTQYCFAAHRYMDDHLLFFYIRSLVYGFITWVFFKVMYVHSWIFWQLAFVISYFYRYLSTSKDQELDLGCTMVKCLTKHVRSTTGLPY